MQPLTLGVREFQNRIGAALRAVRAGRKVTITSRGKPVAVLVRPLPIGRAPAGIDAILRRLADEGRLILGTGGPIPRPKSRISGAGLSQELEAQRRRLDPPPSHPKGGKRHR